MLRPVLPFLGFLISLLNYKHGMSLLKIVFSPVFPRFLWIRQRKKILGKFEGATSVFACGILQGWGLEGWGLGLAELWGFWCLNMANWVQYPLPLF